MCHFLAIRITLTHILFIFEPFLEITKVMEGDKPTGSMVIPLYVMVWNDLIKREQDLPRRGSLYPMISAMIKKTDGILQEALGCETLVMETILNPAFRLRFFSKHFGPTSSKFQEAEAVLDKNFEFYLESFPTKPKSSNHYPSFRRVESGTSRRAFFSEVFSDHEEDEMGADKQLQDYLQGVIKMKAPEYDCEDPAAALLWWKVSIIH